MKKQEAEVPMNGSNEPALFFAQTVMEIFSASSELRETGCNLTQINLLQILVPVVEVIKYEAIVGSLEKQEAIDLAEDSHFLSFRESNHIC